MIALLEPGEVETRLGLNSVPEGAQTLGSAINSAHLRVQSMLDTKFDRTVNTEVFYVSSSKTCGVIPDKRFRLRLKNGFLRASPAPVVTWGESDTDCTQEVTEAKFDMVKGIVYLPEDYEDSFVQVTYEAGFLTKAEAPENLLEGIAAYVPVILEFTVTPSSNANKATDSAKRSAVSQHAIEVLTPLFRTMGFTIDPVF